MWFERSSCSPTAGLGTTVLGSFWRALAGPRRRRRSTHARPIWASREQTTRSGAWNPRALVLRSGKGRLSLALEAGSDWARIVRSDGDHACALRKCPERPPDFSSSLMSSIFLALPARMSFKVEDAMWIAPLARATRRVSGLSPTFTIWACPELSKWLNFPERFILPPSSDTQIDVMRRVREPNPESGIILSMRIPVACLILALLVPRGQAQTLPELGDTSGALLSPYLERKIGEQAMREIRLREPSFLDDPELTEYVNEVGRRIVAASPEARQDFEFFMVRDNTINAFAMPGGFVGVHTGLRLAAQTESELAGVLAHEVAHVTQHHIARLLGK